MLTRDIEDLLGICWWLKFLRCFECYDVPEYRNATSLIWFVMLLKGFALAQPFRDSILASCDSSLFVSLSRIGIHHCGVPGVDADHWSAQYIS